MAYDLFYRRQIPTDISRGQVVTTGAVAGLSVLAAAGLLLVPRMRRRAEIAHYQREFSRDAHKTLEIPAATMREIMYSGPWRRDA